MLAVNRVSPFEQSKKMRGAQCASHPKWQQDRRSIIVVLVFVELFVVEVIVLQVVFEDVRIPAANLLSTEGAGFGIAMAALNGGRINIGACSLGGGQAALDQTVRYLTERVAFGSPLIENPALLFQLADMDTQLESARTLLHRAAQAMDDKDDDLVRVCAMAKLVATDAGFTVANTALQLHGGYGYLSEYGIERIVRDLRVHQILEGTNEIMRLIVGRSLAGAHQ